MSYFRFTGSRCACYFSEWEAVVKQIKGWPPDFGYQDKFGNSYLSPLPQQISHHLEAKALYVLSMTRRLVRAAYGLFDRAGDWHLIFIEATALLFPLLELAGHARLGISGSNKCLWAGIHWLRDPLLLPQVSRYCRTDATKVNVLLGLEVGHLIALRNYYLHGAKNAKDQSGRLIPIPDIMSYKLPEAIATRVQEVMPIYWEQMTQDDGSHGWVKRLAQADVQPLVIQGSGVFERGLVDKDIVDYLGGHRDILGHPVEY
jgi:hypothetical protein